MHYGSDERKDGVDIGGRQHQLMNLLEQRFLRCFQPTMKFTPYEDKIAAKNRVKKRSNKYEEMYNFSLHEHKILLYLPQIIHVSLAKLLGEEGSAEG